MHLAADSSRRTALGLGCGLAFSAVAAAGHRALAIEPFTRPGPPRLRLALAAYSFRKFFRWMRGKPQQPADADRALTIAGFIDLAADLGCDGAELTSYFFDPAELNAGLPELRRQAFLRGIGLSGTAVGNNFARPPGVVRDQEIADVKQWVDRAALLGMPHVRVFAGPVPKDLSQSQARRLCIEALEETADYAGSRGVMLGLENHGGLVTTADELLEIVRAVKSRWFGISLDTGNFHSETIYDDLARCAAYAVNVQYKVEVRRQRRGLAEPADPQRVVRLLRDAGYQGFVALEYEAAADPFAAVPDQLERLRAAVLAA